MINLLKHNQETYENIQEIFRTKNKCCVVQPTGTGKSYLIINLTEDCVDSDRDIIIIEPQKYIFDHLREKMDKYGVPYGNVKTLTYNSLGRMTEEKIKQYNSPQLIMVDETHRAGAVQWGKGLQMMFDSFPADCKYIGLSATPVRYLDGKRNMAEELFDNCMAVELTLADAIIKRILPLPRYIAGLYTYENEINAITKKIQNSSNTDEEKKALMDEVKIMKRNLDKSKGISSIFKKYLVSDNGKFVAFCRDVKHLKEMRPCLEEWFSDAGIKANFYEVHCKNSDNDKQFKAFKEDEGLAICLSVSMLSEGIHGIDGVIMLRDTMSPNVYYQQIGRCFSVGMETNPIIFDLVANCESIMDCGLKTDLLEGIEKKEREIKDVIDIDSGEKMTEITREDIKSFFVFDQVIDSISAFKSIEERLENGWNLNVIALRQFKEREGNCLIPVRHIEILEDGRKVNLGGWVSHMQTAKKNKGRYLLDEQRIGQLMELDFIWDRREYRFRKNINDCIKFYESNGKKPSELSKDDYEKKLGVFWVSNVFKMRNSKLSKWKADLLKQIPTFTDENLSGYDKFYEMSLKYKNKHGHINIKSSDVIEGYNIGIAFGHIKNSYKNKKLTEEQVQKLKDICLDITTGKRELEFNRRMYLARQALNEGIVLGSKNPIYKGIDLYEWFIRSKDKFTVSQLVIMNKLIPSKENKTPIKIIDVKNNQVLIYPSMNEAGRSLNNQFHLVDSDNKGLSAIYKRLSGQTKNPVFKDRFIFQYADKPINM